MTGTAGATRTPGPAVYTATEVASLLRLSQATVYAMAHSGQLPCKKVGRRFIFSRVAIHGWLDSTNPVGR